MIELFNYHKNIRYRLRYMVTIPGFKRMGEALWTDFNTLAFRVYEDGYWNLYYYNIPNALTEYVGDGRLEASWDRDYFQLTCHPKLTQMWLFALISPKVSGDEFLQLLNRDGFTTKYKVKKNYVNAIRIMEGDVQHSVLELFNSIMRIRE